MRSNGTIVYFYTNFIYQFSIYFSFIYWIAWTNLKAGRVGRMIYGLSSERNNIESSKTELQDPSDVFGAITPYHLHEL